MNFLNESAENYPAAISLASGRPNSEFFDRGSWDSACNVFRHWAESQCHAASTQSMLAQYGPTAGVINELVAEQLRNDESIDCFDRDILITSGCQEAISLLVPAICKEPGDVILARSATYIGITGVADLERIPIVGIQSSAGAFCENLRQKVIDLLAGGYRPRALYIVPDFDNPTGVVLTEMERREIIEICYDNEIIVLEDNPYGLFRYDGDDVKRMASLDDRGVVVYLGTYSKTLFPAVRVGCAAIPKALFGCSDLGKSLLADIVERKSFVTVNTSQLNQALVGGYILMHEGSFRKHIEPARSFYKKNRDTLIESLERHFEGLDGLRWNNPAGGFFLNLEIPFRFGREEVEQCAREFGVLAMPMSFFAIDDTDDYDKSMRLAFSNVAPSLITEGVSRLANFIRTRS